ncbi:TesA Lysophospholipase L1 and related esterases [Candidatus Nanopelagicaceae bacterium]
MNYTTTFALIGDSAASGVGDSDHDGNYFGWGYHLVQAFQEPIAYINASRPGAQSAEVLRDQLPKVLIYKPEIVGVIVGGNDLLRNGFSPEVFEENLNETLRMIEESGATSMLLELHDPTLIVPMPNLLARVCRRRVSAVNEVTHKLAQRYSSILLETRTLPGIYERTKWHVDRMHPSKNGHQFLADAFAHLLRQRGFDIAPVEMSVVNNRSKKDSFLWMLRNGTPWFFKRSFDLLPAVLLLMATEFIRDITHRNQEATAEIYFPKFETPDQSGVFAGRNQRVS